MMKQAIMITLEGYTFQFIAIHMKFPGNFFVVVSNILFCFIRVIISPFLVHSCNGKFVYFLFLLFSFHVFLRCFPAPAKVNAKKK